MSGLSLSTADALLRDLYAPVILMGLGETPWSALLLRRPSEGWSSRYTFDARLAAAHRDPRGPATWLPVPTIGRPFLRAGVINLFPRSRSARWRAETTFREVRLRLRGAVAALRGSEVEGVWV